MSFDSWMNHGAPLSQKSFRGVNNNDIVTAVPPEFSDYQHVGTKIYINSRWVLEILSQILTPGQGCRPLFQRMESPNCRDALFFCCGVFARTRESEKNKPLGKTKLRCSAPATGWRREARPFDLFMTNR